MKKFLLFATLGLMAATAGAETYADYFTVYYQGNEVKDGDTIYGVFEEDINTFEAKVYIQNTSLDPVDFFGLLDIAEGMTPTWEQYHNNIPEWGMAQICGGTASEIGGSTAGNCWGSNGQDGNLGFTNQQTLPASDKGCFAYELHNIFFDAPASDFEATYKVTTTLMDDESIKHVFYICYSMSKGSVENLAVDNSAEKEYFTLQGVRVANPDKGLYIVRQGSKASKEIIR